MTKNLIIDLRGASLLNERRTGEKNNLTNISKESGISMMSFQKWDKIAPKNVKVIYDILQENPKLTFDKIMSDKVLSMPFKNSKCVNFLKWFLNKHKKISFNELVKEV